MTERRRVIYPERPKSRARYYAPSAKSNYDLALHLFDVPVTDMHRFKTCVSRRVRKQVIHALGLAGLSRIYRKVGAGSKKSNVRC